jgi:glutathione S-transferase
MNDSMHTGKSPVITDGGQTVAESGAIVDYLINKYGKGRFTVPDTDPNKQLIVSYWSHFAEATLMAFIAINAVLDGVDAHTPTNVQPPPTKPVRDSYVTPNMKLNFQFLESYLGKQAGPYIAGDTLTAADFMLLFPIEEGAATAAAPYVGHHTKQYLQRIRNRPAYKRVLEKGGAYSFA